MKIYITTNLIKKFFPFLLFFISQTIVMGQTVTYEASNNVIANPERGLQKYSITSNNYATTLGANNLSVATLNNWKTSTDKVTVVYRYFILDAFLNSDINATYLNNIQTDFDNIRTSGLKIITRFSYSNAQSTAPQQPSKSQILAHISQLAPLLETNKDIFFSMQAGFIGTWGEWYYTNSSEFGTDGNITSTQWLNRKEIIEAMLAAAPPEIPIQVRYAGIKTNMYGNTMLTEQTAYLNTANARIGFYNDAFLNNYGDQGTYSVSNECTNPVETTEYNYVANETKFLPMTGETNGLNPCNDGFRTTSDNAINEMNLTHWTTINRDYYIPFWEDIISSNAYDDILKQLGYRFVLNASTVTTNTTGFDISLNISNVGFARPFKQRDVFLIIKNTATNVITTEVIDTDIRTWENTVSITQDFNLDAEGTYQLYLWMPDNAPALKNNPDYSIQFANNNTWETATGYNTLLQTITFQTLGVDQFLDDNKTVIYPNPASNFITIALNHDKEQNIKIFNIHGQLVKEASIYNNHKLNISELANGMYFITLLNDKSPTLKFIKH
ncbi:DUF4832 domain-containing protein [Psychroserpens sp. NJDZ02]|uniref:T9SS type A sorting domain-containing protein n=1 Tax=Psychroserpens sp. NJDZ02 TaxID=2570561 RepID=UPI0010A94D00|nr:DUF4832 domain-containing protein [Psychroserpens sp. NJDZ02]QCE42776.1 DUF4832 domain-containing protein [Psychroserpens sp. NJDZ02]